MAAPLSMSVIRHPDLLAGDHFTMEVDGVVQPDKVRLWGATRELMGFGMTPSGQSGFGFGPSLPFGAGIFGAGYFGQGAEAATIETWRPFVAGDYAVRLRAVDELGNAGSWSSLRTIEHRPQPPAPTNLAINAGALAWEWSDPT